MFGALPDTGMAATARRRSCERGEVVCRPGDGANLVFEVCSGRLRVHLMDDARELTLAYLEPGDVFSTHTRAWVTAVQRSQLTMLPTATLSAGLARQAPTMVAVMRVLGRLLAGTVDLVEGLAFRGVRERLALLLATQVQRHGRVQADGVWVVARPFTLTDIAGMLGLSRQTVSAAFAELEREGIVQRRGRRELRVPDLAQLQACYPRKTSAGRQTGARPGH